MEVDNLTKIGKWILHDPARLKCGDRDGFPGFFMLGRYMKIPNHPKVLI